MIRRPTKKKPNRDPGYISIPALDPDLVRSINVAYLERAQEAADLILRTQADLAARAVEAATFSPKIIADLLEGYRAQLDFTELFKPFGGIAELQESTTALIRESFEEVGRLIRLAAVNVIPEGVPSNATQVAKQRPSGRKAASRNIAAASS